MAAENSQTLSTLQDLLRIPSYSRQEGPIQDHIEQLFAASGIETIRQSDNLLVHLKGKDSTRAFIFNGHVDVVDVGDEKRWSHGPWSGDVENGKVYGRGSSDMKAGDAALIETAKKLAKDDVLPCDVWFTFVAREEEDGSGTEAFAQWFKDQGYADQYSEMVAIFAEPTDMNTAEYGHRGNYFLKASIDGDAGHSSRPAHIKTHAVDLMNRFIQEVRATSNKWQKEFKKGEFVPPTITPTAMEAKTGSANKVSDHAEATFDLRTIPGFHKEAFEKIRELAEKRGITLSLLFPDAPIGYTRRNARIIQELQALVPGLKLKVSEGSADLGFLTGLGVEGVMFGPGVSDQAHVIDEYAPVEHLDHAVDIYTKLYYNWAGSKN